MFKLEVEWEEAPGVSDPVLARTWARLKLRINDRDVIQLLDMRSQSLRSAVYGSVFPLAAWIVENWWSLLFEPLPSARVLEGARATHRASAGRYQKPTATREQHLLAWMRRHNLLFSREGMALPDASIFRDEDRIFVRWLRDPAEQVQNRRYFTGEGSARLDAGEVEHALHEFVGSVLERLDDEQESNEVAEFRATWAAILDSKMNEPEPANASQPASASTSHRSHSDSAPALPATAQSSRRSSRDLNAPSQRGQPRAGNAGYRHRASA